jgi:hypothetical protein
LKSTRVPVPPQERREPIHLAQQAPPRCITLQGSGLHQRANPLHGFSHRQQLLHAGQVDARLVDQPLDEPQPLDFILRVEAHAADRASGPHESEPFVLAQRLRMHVQHPRRIRDENQLHS